MEQQGWVKFYREWLDNPIITKDSEHLAVWIYLNCSATHIEKDVIFNGKKITLRRGQMIVSCKEIYEKLKIERNKMDRIIKLFKNEELIEQQTSNHKSLITLARWDFYQGFNEEQNEEPIRNQRGANQETENEKEKRSKREKDKEKEKNKNEKNERSVCVGAHTYGHTQKDLLFLGRYKNVVVSQEFYEEFKEKYWYYDKVIDKLSAYKKARNIVNNDDIPYLEQFAIEDKDKYIKPGSSFDTFDADEAFAAALKRSYAKDDDEW
jgi:hypothetical protein